MAVPRFCAFSLLPDNPWEEKLLLWETGPFDRHKTHKKLAIFEDHVFAILRSILKLEIHHGGRKPLDYIILFF